MPGFLRSGTAVDNSTQRDIWTVSRLNSELRAVLDQSFPLLWVSGEISGLAQPRSGHLYFSLKDAASQIRCALFRNKRNLLRFQPKDGDQVVARVRVSCYEPRGELQLIVEQLEPAGAGALQQAFEALKAKLQAEGLFATERKRPLPRFPRRVGVVTSASGAALRDVLHVLARRFPALPVLIYPVPVQGAGAASEIAETLRLADRRGDCDLLILTRGGGSPEDLAQFNDEALARTIAALQTPIVAAIGHEIDFSIAEFVADRRAPTPSAAAELVSPDGAALQQRLTTLRRRLEQAQRQHSRHGRQALAALQGRLRPQHPSVQLRQRQQRLDELGMRLEGATRQQLIRNRHGLATLAARLAGRSPRAALAARGQHLLETRRRLLAATRHGLQRRRQQLAALGHQLHIVSPLSTLERGYTITRQADSAEVIRRHAQVRAGDRLETLLAEGRIISEVRETFPPEDPQGG
jgi:exodeoxyribonuclease VII large subunit